MSIENGTADITPQPTSVRQAWHAIPGPKRAAIGEFLFGFGVLLVSVLVLALTVLWLYFDVSWAKRADVVTVAVLVALSLVQVAVTGTRFVRGFKTAANHA